MSDGDWRERDAEHPHGEPHMVRYFDTDRRRVIEIPASELASTVVRVRMEGVEGEVWIDADKLTPGEVRQPPLSEALRRYIRRIKAAFQEHRPLSVEDWEGVFRRDQDPEGEIALWAHAADVYQAFAEPEPSAERRRSIYDCIVVCLMATPETVQHILPPSCLSRDEIAEIVGAYFGA